jgi:hypothetical protein
MEYRIPVGDRYIGNIAYFCLIGNADDRTMRAHRSDLCGALEEVLRAGPGAAGRRRGDTGMTAHPRRGGSAKSITVVTRSHPRPALTWTVTRKI